MLFNEDDGAGVDPRVGAGECAGGFGGVAVVGEMGGKVDAEGVVSGGGMWVVWSPLVREGVGAASGMSVCWNSCG